MLKKAAEGGFFVLPFSSEVDQSGNRFFGGTHVQKPGKNTPAAQDAAQENSVYLDGLNNSAEDISDLKKEKAGRATGGDKIVVTVLAVLNLAVLVVIALLMRSGDRWKTYGSESNTPLDPETDFYRPADAISADLTPAIRGVVFPDGIQDSFKALYSSNQDVVGWIRVGGTCIDFPVLQAEDNLKYERANFYLQSDHRGSIWMDFRNDVGPGRNSLSRNTIIYGHHLTTDDAIFAELENFENVEFYKQNPVIEMNTLYDNYKWKIFACFVTNAEPQDDNGHVFYYWTPYLSDEEMPGFTQEVMRRSWIVNPAVDILPTDKLLTLSTCTYMMNISEYYEMRCVVMARLVREGEDEAVDVTNAWQNQNCRMPQLWYTQKGIINPFKDVPVFIEY